MTDSRWDRIHIRSDVTTHSLALHHATQPPASHEPDPVELMRWARWVQAEAAQLVECAVAQARADRVTWATIGEVHGTTRQAAHERFSGGS